jgi:hypothetical protein
MLVRMERDDPCRLRGVLVIEQEQLEQNRVLRCPPARDRKGAAMAADIVVSRELKSLEGTAASGRRPTFSFLRTARRSAYVLSNMWWGAFNQASLAARRAQIAAPQYSGTK